MTGGEKRRELFKDRWVVLDDYSESVKEYVRTNRNILETLHDWSGQHPDCHSWDLHIIMSADGHTTKNPNVAIERAELIRRGAIEIERTLTAMEAYDRDSFEGGLCRSKHIDFVKLNKCIGYESDLALEICRAFQDAADFAKEKIQHELEHLPVSKNENRRNIAVAIAVADIYSRHTDREPPKSGDNGPFQRLLRDIYLALGRTNVDLRGPLRKVHEYRKNRHSCS